MKQLVEYPQQFLVNYALCYDYFLRLLGFHDLFEKFTVFEFSKLDLLKNFSQEQCKRTVWQAIFIFRKCLA